MPQPAAGEQGYGDQAGDRQEFSLEYGFAGHCVGEGSVTDVALSGIGATNNRFLGSFLAIGHHGEAIAFTAYGLYQGIVAAGLQGLAQAADMHVDGAFLDIDIVAPDHVQ